MLRYTSDEISRLVFDDVGLNDISTDSQKINHLATLSMSARQAMVLSSLDGLEMMAKLYDLEFKSAFKNGDFIDKDVEFATFLGDYNNLQAITKSANILAENACAIATKTKKLLKIIKENSTKCQLFATRKVLPFAKKMCLKAVLDGGANIHRYNLNDSFLYFNSHIKASGGMSEFLANLKAFKQTNCKAVFGVEAKNLAEFRQLLQPFISIIQCDKFDFDELKIAAKLAKEHQKIILATGGINEENIARYASLDIDGIVSSAMYHASPVDVKSSIKIL